MSEFWDQTRHLQITDSGHVYVHSLAPDAELFDTELCGHVARTYWPEDLGQEPDWFWREVDELTDFFHAECRRLEIQARNDLALRHAEYNACCLGTP